MFYFVAPIAINIVFVSTALVLALFAARDLPLVGLIFAVFCFALLLRYLSGGRARKNLLKFDNLRKSIKVDARSDEMIVVPSGERVPADGIVSEDEATLNEFPLTGSPRQILKRKGDLVYAATINEGADFKMTVQRIGKDVMLCKIIDTVRAAGNFPGVFQKKSVLAVAFLGGLVLLVGGAYSARIGNPGIFISLLLIFSLDAGVFYGSRVLKARVSRMALYSVIARGIGIFERVGMISRVVFNPDVYLSRSRKDFSYLRAFWGALDNDVLALAASAEKYCDHPLADAILATAHQKDINYKNPDTFSVVKGEGAVITLDGVKVIVGSESLIRVNNIHIQDEIKNHIDSEKQRGMETVLVVYGSKIIGVLSFGDTKKNELKAVRSQLEMLGVKEAGKEENQQPALIIGGKANADLSDKNIYIFPDVLGPGSFLEKADVLLMNNSFGALQKLIISSRSTSAVLRNVFVLLLVFNIAGIFLIWAGLVGPYNSAILRILIEFFVFIFMAREAKKDEMA